MLRIYIISLTSILAIHATLIPSLHPWSTYQYAKQNNIENILQTQSYPLYTCSPLTMVVHTLAHSLAVHGTDSGYSLQNDREKSSESGDVPLWTNE
jgi:ABC-type enterochelin transport system permease subunit